MSLARFPWTGKKGAPGRKRNLCELLGSATTEGRGRAREVEKGACQLARRELFSEEGGGEFFDWVGGKGGDASRRLKARSMAIGKGGRPGTMRAR